MIIRGQTFDLHAPARRSYSKHVPGCIGVSEGSLVSPWHLAPTHNVSVHAGSLPGSPCFFPSVTVTPRPFSQRILSALRHLSRCSSSLTVPRSLLGPQDWAACLPSPAPRLPEPPAVLAGPHRGPLSSVSVSLSREPRGLPRMSAIFGSSRHPAHIRMRPPHVFGNCSTVVTRV